MRFRHAFIVTYGRTGSTLLQGVLNACPGVTIHGENHGFYYYAYKAYESALLARKHLDGVGPSSPTHAFYGADGVDLPHLKSSIATLMREHLYRGHESTGMHGFKEVRYDMPDLHAYLDFLAETFARSCFIFLTRDAHETATSGFWRGGDAGLVMAKLRYMEHAFSTYWELHPGNCLSLDYADLRPDSLALAHLLEHLGLAIDQVTLCKVLNSPHSYDVQSMVFYDNAKIARRPAVYLDAVFEVVHFEKTRLDLGRRMAFTGIAMPLPSMPPLERIYAVSHADPTEIHEATFGLATPGYASRHRANPHAVQCRFGMDFIPHGSVYALHAVLGNQDVTIADIHVATPVTRVFSD